MNLISRYLREEWITPLGWTLLHFVWQGAALALVLAALLFLLRHRPASLRYLVCCATLLLLTLCPLLTFLTLSPHPSLPVVPARTTPATPDPQQRSGGKHHEMAIVAQGANIADASPAPGHLIPPADRSLIDHLLPWGVLGWSFGVLLFCVRLAGSSLAVYRLTHSNTLPTSEALESRLRVLAGQMGVARPIRLLESTRVVVPTVVGCIRAVILLPVSTVTGLPQPQIEALLAHELAHIRRYDHLVNLWQVMLETLLFYHPAVWWISRQLRMEREHCCDDLALLILDDRKVYARALASLAAQQHDGRPVALASNGGELLPRIRRILGLSPLPPQRSMLSSPIHALLSALLMASLLAWQSSSRTTVTAARGRQTKGAGPEATEGSPHKAGAQTPDDFSDASAVEALRKASDYYQSLSSFSMRIENHYTSGLFPTEYAQTLRWRKPDRFELLVTSKQDAGPAGNRANGDQSVPDYRADGRQLITATPNGRRFVGAITPEPNTEPGWEVSAGPILSWLQNTESGNWMLDGKALPPHWQFGRGPRTMWHGYHVRELLGRNTGTSRYYPHGWYSSMFLDAEKPILIGEETNAQHRIGWALYADQKANPILPQTLGQVSTAP
jgi:beta-lactamase regulating signal transducer with metallopeptidase domain